MHCVILIKQEASLTSQWKTCRMRVQVEEEAKAAAAIKDYLLVLIALVIICCYFFLFFFCSVARPQQKCFISGLNIA